MSVRAATVASESLVGVFEHVPEYSGYDSSDFAQTCESDYRVSLGREIKRWGDQLLDLAEGARPPLSRSDMHTVDRLLGRIGELFDQLNAFGEARVPARDRRRREMLRHADASILSSVELSGELLDELVAGRDVSEQLDATSVAIDDALRLLSDRLRRRNEVLSRRSR